MLLRMQQRAFCTKSPRKEAFCELLLQGFLHIKMFSLGGSMRKTINPRDLFGLRCYTKSTCTYVFMVISLLYMQNSSHRGMKL